MSERIKRSIRLISSDARYLNSTSGSPGEIFYDVDANTLRIMDGETKGGSALAAGATVSATPPTTAQNGQTWINSITGVLYVYYVDTLGGQWIQPVTEPQGIVDVVAGQQAALASFGLVKVDDNTIVADESGTISTTLANTFTDAELNGIATFTSLSGTVVVITGATGVVEHDLSQSTGFYHTEIQSNFSANFTNVSTVNNQATTIALVLNQGSTPYIPNAVLINGASQNIAWANDLEPTGNSSSIDEVVFTLIRVNSSWVVTGSLSSTGASE